MRDRPTSRAKSSSGRETSFGRDTSGYKGWIPILFKQGTHGGPPQEGFKNVLTNEEVVPQKGWNGEPPGPTGELTTRHSSAYCEGWERIWGKKEEHNASP
jgi:hypothetical protein